jgi:hypothetical protein
MAPPPGTRQYEDFGDLADDHQCFEDDQEVRL